MSLPERVRVFLESLLPWWDPRHEARRDRRSARIERLSEVARREAEDALRLARIDAALPRARRVQIYPHPHRRATDVRR
jgi:hypothetical protein